MTTLTKRSSNKEDELTAAEKLTNTHRSVQRIKQTVEIITRLCPLNLSGNSFRSGRIGSVSVDCVYSGYEWIIGVDVNAAVESISPCTQNCLSELEACSLFYVTAAER